MNPQRQSGKYRVGGAGLGCRQYLLVSPVWIEGFQILGLSPVIFFSVFSPVTVPVITRKQGQKQSI